MDTEKETSVESVEENATADITPNEQPDDAHNVFDTAFRTIIGYMPELIIPIINEIFKTAYPMEKPVVRKNEHFTYRGKIVTDLLVAEQIKRIAEYLAPDNEKERVIDMGGTVMKPQAQIILEQGEERGRNEGKETQARETAKNLYDMGLVGLGVDKIVQAVSYPVEVVKQWLGLVTV